MHGTVEANLAMQHADLIIGVGMRFDDRVVGRPTTSRPAAQHRARRRRPAGLRTRRARRRASAGRRARGAARAGRAVPSRATVQPGGRACASGRTPTPIAAWSTRETAAAGRAADHARSGPHLAAGAGRRGDAGRRHRPAPDVRRAAPWLRPTGPDADQRRPGHDGLRAAGGDGRENRAARAARSGQSSATAASR